MRLPIPIFATVVLLLILVGSLFSLVQGALHLPPRECLLALCDTLFGTHWSSLDDYQRVVVTDLRLPRLVLSILVGALLAQCGAVMQGLFRNPLADPGIIGVSSGAAVGAIIAIALLPATLMPLGIPASAFLGGLLTTLLVYSLSHSKQGTSVLVLLLAGIAISAFAGATIGFISYFANDDKLRQLSLWQMGSLSGAGQVNLWIGTIIIWTLAITFQKQASALNALVLGECEARYLGISVETLKYRLIVLAAVGVGISVAYAGIIGFIGLVVPHLGRLLTGPDHRSLIPLSALCGALLLLIADLLARTLVQPAELPVGLVTALLGAPFFLALLIQQRRQWQS